MNVKNFSMVLALAAMCVSNVSAQNFFWSTANFGEGAINGDFSANVEPGAMGTTYLYYDAAGTQNITEGIDLDFSWDNTGVIAFTAAETFEFDIEIAGADVGDRWGDFAGPADTVSADAVTGFLTINVVNGTGIQVANIPPGAPFEDVGYDTSADAFFVGSFDWTVTGNAGTASIQIDNALVVDGGQNIDVPFSGFTVTVVPEPTSASLLAMGLIGLVSRRRR